MLWSNLLTSSYVLTSEVPEILSSMRVLEKKKCLSIPIPIEKKIIEEKIPYATQHQHKSPH